MSLGLPQKNGVGSMEPGIEDYNGLYIWDVIPNGYDYRLLYKIDAMDDYVYGNIYGRL